MVIKLCKLNIQTNYKAVRGTNGDAGEILVVAQGDSVVEVDGLMMGKRPFYLHLIFMWLRKRGSDGIN